MQLIVEWIVRGRLSDKYSRSRIKKRVRLVQNALVPRSIDAVELEILRFLAITECRIVTPGSVKQLVAFYTNGKKLGNVLGIAFAVAEIENT